MAFDYSYYGEDTMQKVYKGLKHAGLTDDQVVNAVNRVMNEGIVFREPRPPGPVIVNSDSPRKDLSSKSSRDMTFCVIEDCSHLDTGMKVTAEKGRARCSAAIAWLGCTRLRELYDGPLRDSLAYLVLAGRVPAVSGPGRP